MIVALLDGMLALTLLWTANRALATEDLFKAVAVFVAFGLLVALAWVRLGGVDLALAEAGVGVGFTGALLLAALPQTGARPPARRAARAAGPGLGRSIALAVLLACCGGALAWALLDLPAPGAHLAEQAHAHLHDSGVDNPVTAALLNYRGYDTLLELTVLTTTLVAVWSLGDMPVLRTAPLDPVLRVLTGVLLPLLVLLAGFLLWSGAHAPGGAFQAGAVLAAAGILAVLSREGGPQEALGWLRPGPLRALLVVGLVTFMAVAVAGLAAGAPLLTYPPGRAGGLILLIESAATLSIGLTLLCLFLGGRPSGGSHA